MFQKKTRILGIVPYETMKPVMARLAEKRSDITAEIYVGDMNRGCDIVSNLSMEDYDIIISRGGTAQLIGRSASLPVVEINVSVYDVLRAIRLAEGYSGKYAIIGFDNITGSASLLCDLLQLRIPIYTIHDQEEARKLLVSLKAEGCQLVICDMITNSTAREMEMNAILITSGAESIEAAFDEAVKTHSMLYQMKEQQQFLDSIVQNANAQTAVFSLEGELIYCCDSLRSDTEFLNILAAECPSAFSTDNYKAFKRSGDILYSLESRLILSGGRKLAVFYATGDRLPALRTKRGISYLNLKETEDFLFNSFYGAISPSGEFDSLITTYAQSSYPVMLIGERGTRKQYIAGTVYTRSDWRNHPLIKIDCARLTDREWGFLVNHYNSPLNDKENTLFFNNLRDLKEEHLQALLSLILEQRLHRKNRLIFSCFTTAGQPLPNIINKFINDLSCLVINAPALRENLADLPAFSSLYLNSLNIALSRQIIGFMPDALELLQNYSWPGNYTQLKRILRELALTTSTSYIQPQQVRQALSTEVYCGEPSVSPVPNAMSFTGSLEEIIKSIVRRTVDEMDGNQSAAAKRLQISRTTLWRYMKQYESQHTQEAPQPASGEDVITPAP